LFLCKEYHPQVVSEDGNEDDGVEEDSEILGITFVCLFFFFGCCFDFLLVEVILDFLAH
jgi:hypothetical protein